MRQAVKWDFSIAIGMQVSTYDCPIEMCIHIPYVGRYCVIDTAGPPI